jgi:F-type H+-transporting ATPase subunit alpha
MSVADMGLSIYTAEKGHLKDIAIDKILDFEAALISYANSEYAELMATINESGDYNGEIDAKLGELVEKFKATQTW